ncbi:MAG TPA: S8 family serine peptidase [Pyrinomonadaceae bacterium]|nr:S8 family serine peptidase [Pyrinomonadaceae bacterium]
MNRQNFVKHLSLALVIVLVAGLAGQFRRWQRERAAWVESQAALKAKFPEHERTVPDLRREADDIIVRFKAGVGQEQIRAITRRLNDDVDDRIEAVEGLVEINDYDGHQPQDVVDEYASLPEVEYAELNEQINLEDPPTTSSPRLSATVSSPNAPNDPMFDEQWALVNAGQREGKNKADISALLAWEKTRGTDNVVVAVLDSGVDYTHPDLINNMWLRPDYIAPYEDEHLGTIDDLHGFNAVDNLRDPMDDNGHGTHCAGIIGAEGNNGEGIAGVNWKVDIMPLKFMSAGGYGTTKDAIEAINYVIQRKRDGVNVRIISASWGSTTRSRALEDVIRKAGEEGILFVAASGNSTANTDKRPHYPSSYKLPNVLSVAALTRRDELAGFSNFGAKSVHIAAPGAEILSTWLHGDYREASGTSMATPVVSGVAALVISVNPDITLEQLRTRLLDTADQLDTLKGKVSSGGRVNAARAVGASD